MIALQGLSHLYRVATVATGQRWPAGRPGRSRRRQRGRQAPKRFLGQCAIRGEFAAQHAQQRGAGGVQLQPVIAGDLRCSAMMIGQQRAHAAVAPDDVFGLDRHAQEPVHRIKQIGLLLRARFDPRRITVVIGVGGADQGEVLLERDREHHALVGLLEQVGAVMCEQAQHHQVAALHEPQPERCIQPRALQHRAGPGAAGVDHAAGADALHVAAGRTQHRPPVVAVADQLFAAGAGADIGTALVCIQCV